MKQAFLHVQNTIRQKRYGFFIKTKDGLHTKPSIVEDEVILSSRLIRFLRWQLKHSKY